MRFSKIKIIKVVLARPDDLGEAFPAKTPDNSDNHHT